MKNFSDELLHRIEKARKANVILACTGVSMIGVSIWLYQYSGIHIPYYINAIIVFSVIVVGSITYDSINSAIIVYCPKCNSVIEKGKMVGDSIPLCCPRCGLNVSNKKNR